MIDDIYFKALMSDAAYIEMGTATTLSGVSDDLFVERGWTQSQIDDFKANFSLAHTQFNYDSGLSLTVFEDNEGHLTVAFRGTEPTGSGLAFS